MSDGDMLLNAQWGIKPEPKPALERFADEIEAMSAHGGVAAALDLVAKAARRASRG